jgi:hypothetical protein
MSNTIAGKILAKREAVAADVSLLIIPAKKFEPTHVGCYLASRRPVTGGTHNAKPCPFAPESGQNCFPKIYLTICETGRRWLWLVWT